MIEQIFISDDSNKILYGNQKLLPEILQYPLHIENDKRISQLKINDVILSILYCNYDNFTSAKILQDLKLFLESKILKIDSKTVKENYFLISELLNNINSILISQSFDKERILPDNNAYIDIVEKIHAVIESDGNVIKNCLFGNVICSSGTITQLKTIITKSKKYEMIMSSKYNFKDHLNRIELEASKLNQDPVILSYSILNLNHPIISFKKNTKNCYTFICNPNIKFKNLLIKIPFCNSTYAAEIKSSAGTFHFDINSSLVVWEFKDFNFSSESIEIEPKFLTLDDFKFPIQIEFTISEYLESGICIESSNAGNTQFWAHCTTQSGHYEIRQ